MREANGNMWDMDEVDAYCIPTNGYVNARGECVMGRGVALEAKRRYRGIAIAFGNQIHHFGNHIHPVKLLGCPLLISFPVKHHWRERADIMLIERSANELMEYLNGHHMLQIAVLPRPGCGNGRLRWADVRPVIAPLLDDRVVVVTL